ncbi:MAG: MaoC family dehydratase [Flavobacteriaceae bacterium]|nr:MaoC family dehydratase [Flavobacteriaceae bacterium]
METLVFKNNAAFREMKGKELPNSEWITVSQQMINDFANATLDTQWVHVDVERAKKESPFKSTIAHGFMSVALLSQFLGDIIKIESIKMGLNYGLNYVRFMNPVPVNSQLRLISTVKDVENHKHGIKATFSCTVEIKGEEKPACVAEFLALFIE